MKNHSKFRDILFNRNTLFLLALFFCCLFFIKPVLSNFFSGVYGFPGDAFHTVWWMWWQKYAFFNKFDLEFNHLADAPWGRSYDTGIDQPFLKLLLRFVAILLGEIPGYNILVILSFFLTSFATFLLAKKIFRYNWLSALVGVAVGFSLFMRWHALQNIELVMLWWAPLCLLFLVNAYQRASAINSLMAALCFVLLGLTSFYNGFFFSLILFLLALLLLVFFKPLKQKAVRKRVVNIFLVWGIGVLIFLTLLGFPLIKNQFSANKVSSSLTDLVGKRSSQEALAYAARPWDYLLPSSLHPVFGQKVEVTYQAIEKWGNDFEYKSTSLPERVNYLGWVLIALSFYGLLNALYRWRVNKMWLVFFCLAALSFLISLPGIWTFKGTTFYLPSFFLYRIFPMFRVYARIGFWVLFSLAFLAGFGLQVLLERFKRCAWRAVLIIIVLAFGIFENLDAPATQFVSSLQNIPPVYVWLKDQPAGTIFVEYPKDMELGGGCTDNVPLEIKKDYVPTATLIFQRFHKQPFFGHERLSLEDQQSLAFISEEEACKILVKHGVDFVLFITKDPFPSKNPLDTCQNRRFTQVPHKVCSKLFLEKKFDGAVVYGVLKE